VPRQACRRRPDQPIQGGTRPTGGTDTFAFDGWVPIRAHVRCKFMDHTALWFNPVTKTHDIWMERTGKTIKGKLRLQFSFLSPALTPGVFTIYSCLGVPNFTARPK
jgi:hypothetical protein